ncbi:methyltransferase [Candidatus Woesearchaeota archaeon]|nr:methyltransferase [Candidatus Woesearchaeota archaeon]
MSAWRFFLRFIEKPSSVGAVKPSSRALVRAMLAPIDWSRVGVVAEFGPGTGVMTRGILKRMAPQARLVAYEVDPLFARKLLNIADQRLHVRNVGAQQLDVGVDAIISSLPLNALPASVSHAVLSNAAKRLKPGGLFVQFQYTTMQERLLKRYFAVEKRRFVLWNLPPAFVYVCRKN